LIVTVEFGYSDIVQIRLTNCNLEYYSFVDYRKSKFQIPNFKQIQMTDISKFQT